MNYLNVGRWLLVDEFTEVESGNRLSRLAKARRPNWSSRSSTDLSRKSCLATLRISAWSSLQSINHTANKRTVDGRLSPKTRGNYQRADIGGSEARARG